MTITTPTMTNTTQPVISHKTLVTGYTLTMADPNPHMTVSISPMSDYIPSMTDKTSPMTSFTPTVTDFTSHMTGFVPPIIGDMRKVI